MNKYASLSLASARFHRRKRRDRRFLGRFSRARARGHRVVKRGVLAGPGKSYSHRKYGYFNRWIVL